ncbi:MAG: class I SAM-dependent methyltransferase [Anaerolineales bacterium]|nr:class I SAM-dependent methyltransferase [Anaerolineales bacterium]
MPTVTLKIGRTKSAARRHPWIFSGAIERVDGEPTSGATVAVRGPSGDLLGWGAWSPRSQIAVRLWTFDPEVEIGPAFFRARLRSALAARQRLHAAPDLNAYRLVNAESDGLPGVVVDRYAGFLVCQFLSAGAEAWKAAIVEALAEAAPAFIGAPAGIFERSDVDVRAKEGLAPRVGELMGDTPPARVSVREYDCRFEVDVRGGHKTGFYLDQRDNRRLLASDTAEAEVLNCFAYTGAFGVWALRGGAQRVTNVDTSASALALADVNLALNGFDPAQAENVTGDVFAVLRRYRDSRRTFDVVVLDPPKFAESRAQIEGATRGYKDINLLALKLLRPGGRLFTFSCSGLISPDLFQKIVAGAAEDAGRSAQIVRRLWQGPDHPVALSFPEGEYLKGLVVRVGDQA